jgi:hypothetical protein
VIKSTTSPDALRTYIHNKEDSVASTGIVQSIHTTRRHRQYRFEKVLSCRCTTHICRNSKHPVRRKFEHTLRWCTRCTSPSLTTCPLDAVHTGVSSTLRQNLAIGADRVHMPARQSDVTSTSSTFDIGKTTSQSRDSFNHVITFIQFNSTSLNSMSRPKHQRLPTQ